MKIILFILIALILSINILLVNSQLNGVAVSCLIFSDFNSNGIREDIEFGINGIKLSLVDEGAKLANDANGIPLTLSKTASGGVFLFENIAPGRYYALVDSGLPEFFNNPGYMGPIEVLNDTLSSALKLPGSVAVQSKFSQDLGNYGLVPKGRTNCTGRVFYDFNFDSKFNGVDKPAFNVSIKLYTQFYNTLIATALTDQNGIWIINNIRPGMRFHVKLDIKPSEYVPTDTPPERLVFGGQTEINFGLRKSYALDISPKNTTPTGFITTFMALEPDATEIPTVVSIPENATMPPPTEKLTPPFDFVKTLARQKDTGCVYGVTYRPETGDTFVSAYYRAYSVFGPSGGGAIYRIDKNQIVSTYVDLNNIFGADYVGNLTNIHRKESAIDQSNWVLNGTKVSLGGLDSTQENLFVTILKTNEVVRIPLRASPDSNNVVKTLIPNDGYCLNDSDWRIFAVKVYNDEVYVGGVCTGDTPKESINGTIVKININSKLEKVVTFKLDHSHRMGLQTFKNWASRGATQAIVSQLSFDDQGAITIAVKDRYSDYCITSKDAGFPDLLMACKSSNGDYQMEAGLRCGSKVSLNKDPYSMFGIDGTRFYDTNLGSNSFADGVARAGPNTVIVTGHRVQSKGGKGFAFLNSDTGLPVKYIQMLNDQSNSTLLNKQVGIGSVASIDPLIQISGIRGFIWFDCDGDGIRDPNEPGIVNIKVSLVDVETSTELSSSISNYTGYFNLNGTTYGKKYKCVIQSSDINFPGFEDFVLSPASTNSAFEFSSSDAKQVDDTLVSEFDGGKNGEFIFKCHFGINKKNNSLKTPFGNYLSKSC